MRQRSFFQIRAERKFRSIKKGNIKRRQTGDMFADIIATKHFKCSDFREMKLLCIQAASRLLTK